jgi:hypothetical protein
MSKSNYKTTFSAHEKNLEHIERRIKLNPILERHNLQQMLDWYEDLMEERRNTPCTEEQLRVLREFELLDGYDEFSNDDPGPYKYFWLAINKDTCTASPSSLTDTVKVTPTPELLLGFYSQEDQLNHQKEIQTLPKDQVEMYLKKLVVLAADERIALIVCEDPQSAADGVRVQFFAASQWAENDTKCFSYAAPIEFDGIADENPEELRRAVEQALDPVTERFGHKYDMGCLAQNMSDVRYSVEAGLMPVPETFDALVEAIVAEYRANLAAATRFLGSRE